MYSPKVILSLCTLILKMNLNFQKVESDLKPSQWVNRDNQ